jgi:hypothetical protein
MPYLILSAGGMRARRTNAENFRVQVMIPVRIGTVLVMRTKMMEDVAIVSVKESVSAGLM